MAYDRVERLTDLLLVLLHSRRPLPLEEIARHVPGYPEGLSARRQAFERDKRLLREEGIPVITEAIEGREQYGYRIEPDRYYLPELRLDRDEQRALHLAVAGVHLSDHSGRGGLLKLGATALGEPGSLASIETPAHLHTVWEALRTHSRLQFGYRGVEREVSPGGLWFRRGRWYLVGWDHGPDAARTFRVDRIEDVPTMAAPGGASYPTGFDPASGVPDEPWRVGEGEERQVVFAVDQVAAPLVLEEIGQGSVRSSRENQHTLIELAATNFGALRSWLLGLLDHVELLEPAEWRAEMIAWLRATAERRPRQATSGARSDTLVAPVTEPTEPSPITPTAPGAGTTTRSAPSTGAETPARLQRLLAMVGWLAQVGEASIDEISERFALDPQTVVRELEMAACCGLPPYTPDALMEIVVTEDRVRASLSEDLARPRRLTAADGLAVVASARTILAIPGADPSGALARALSKLEAALGRQHLSVDLDDPPLLAQVRRAVDQGDRVDILYYSLSSDRTTQRRIDPLQLMAIEGHWYMDGVDVDGGDASGNAPNLARGETRRFRVDRISELHFTGEKVKTPPLDGGLDGGPRPGAARSDGPGPAFVPGPESTLVRLCLSPSAMWLIDAVPVEELHEQNDGSSEVSLYVGGIGWLERLLVQLGPEGELVAPEELRHVGSAAAQRLLDRYERSAPQKA